MRDFFIVVVFVFENLKLESYYNPKPITDSDTIILKVP